MLGSTKHNEGENDVFNDKSHLFWTLLMELINKVYLKFKIVIIELIHTYKYNCQYCQHYFYIQNSQWDSRGGSNIQL